VEGFVDSWEIKKIMTNKYYALPDLPYAYNALEPHISEEQLNIHHTIHHNAYVEGANGILKKLEEARRSDSDLDLKSVLKSLSFNIGGIVLHSLFWENLAPEKESGEPNAKLKAALEAEYGSLERFQKEFTAAALTVEGSGWGALVYDQVTSRPLVMQIEKHNTNLYPNDAILMLVDVFEHAYYIDYKNARAKFLEAFWQIANWQQVSQRFDKIK
jgi:Fe-Mn family superoxide dismutase